MKRSKQMVEATRERRSEAGSSLNFLLGLIFRKAWQVWNQHHGNVPDDALYELDQWGDWPEGTAALAMKRISGDAVLRKQLANWSAKESYE